MNVLELEVLKVRATMYGLDIPEETFSEWEQTWTKVNDKLVLIVQKCAGTFYKYLQKFVIEDHTIHLLMVWDFRYKTPKFFVCADTAFEDIDTIWKEEDRDKFIFTTENYRSLSRGTLIKEETLKPENLKTFLYFNSITTGYNPLFLFRERDPAFLVNREVQSFEHGQKWFKANFTGWGYQNFNGITVIETLLHHTSWFTKLLFNKKLEEVFPNLNTILNGNNEKLKEMLPTRFLQEILDVYELESGDRWFVTVGLANVENNTVRFPGNTYISFNSLTSNHRLWNYVDVGRKLYYPRAQSREQRVTYHDHGRVNNEVAWQKEQRPEGGLSNCEIIFTEDEPLLPKTEEPLQRFVKRNPSEEARLVTNREIDRLIKFNIRKTKEEKDISEEEKTRSTKWQLRLEKMLLDPKITATLNEVKFNSKQVIYENQIIRCDQINPIHLLNNLSMHYDLNRINFDSYLEEYMRRIALIISKEKKEFSFTGLIGNVPFKVEIIPKVDSNRRLSTVTHVNEIRINKEEVEQVLLQALCFNDLPTYNQFLNTVSGCSLKIHGYLHHGLEVCVTDEFLGIPLKLKFNLKRNKNKHFLCIGEEKYPIHDINRLFNMKAAAHMNEVLSILEDEKIITLDTINLGSIIGVAKNEYAEALKRSKALLEKVCGIVGTKLEIREVNGSKRNGYIVQGKIREYFLEHSEQATVYNMDAGGRPICIVEKTGEGGAAPKDQVGVDKLVNRMLAIKNDNYIAQYVHTL